MFKNSLLGVPTLEYPTSYAKLEGGSGSVNRIRLYTNVVEAIGTGFTVVSSSAAGTTITINEDGLYAFIRQDGGNAGSSQIGFSIDCPISELNTDIGSITGKFAAIHAYMPAGAWGVLPLVTPLKRGQIVRSHDNLSSNSPNRTAAGEVKLYVIQLVSKAIA